MHNKADYAYDGGNSQTTAHTQDWTLPLYIVGLDTRISHLHANLLSHSNLLTPHQTNPPTHLNTLSSCCKILLNDLDLICGKCENVRLLIVSKLVHLEIKNSRAMLRQVKDFTLHAISNISCLFQRLSLSMTLHYMQFCLIATHFVLPSCQTIFRTGD